MPPPTPHRVSFDSAAAGPLAGVRVLDLSRLVAGNMLSLQLADFGADVVKVEPPAGDPLRDWRDGGKELHWKTYARNKRSIVLNLRHDGAKDALLRLVAHRGRPDREFPSRERSKRSASAPRSCRRKIPVSSSCASRASARPDPMRRCRGSARWSKR